MGQATIHLRPSNLSHSNVRLSRRIFALSSAAAFVSATLHYDSVTAASHSSYFLFAGEPESTTEIEATIANPADVYEGPSNMEFETISSTQLSPGSVVLVTGAFGDFLRISFASAGTSGNEIAEAGFVAASSIKETDIAVPELTIEEVPWASPISTSDPHEYSNASTDQLTEQIGDSYKVPLVDFKLTFALAVPVYADPAQNHGILISNADQQGDANNLLAVVRTNDVWSFWQVNVPRQEYARIADFKEATPEMIEGSLRVSADGTVVRLSGPSMVEESFTLPVSFYDQHRWVDIFAASAGHSTLIVQTLSLLVPPSGEYIQQ